MKDETVHLTDDQILLSLAGEEDLPEAMGRHLHECPACRDRRTSFLAELDRLGKAARESTPAPGKVPALPGQAPARPRYRIPVFATGFSAAVLAALVCVFVLFSDSSKKTGTERDVNPAVRFHLLEDILSDTLVSEQYSDITATSYSYFDDEFMEFVIPLEEEPGRIQGFLTGTVKA